MALTIGRVTAGTTVRSAELNQLIDLLEGDEDETLAFFLRSETGEDFTIKLSDNAGARSLIIQDSDGNTVFEVDSNGNITQSGSFAPSGIVLPSSASPTPTAEGEIHWDSDDHRIVVGDGASQQTFYPGTDAAIWDHIDTQVLGSAAASISFASLDTDYKAFRLTCLLLKDGTGGELNMRFNNDSGSNYNWDNESTGAAGVTYIELAGSTAFAGNTFGMWNIVVGKQTAAMKGFSTGVASYGDGSGGVHQGVWLNTTDLINRIDIICGSGNLAIGSRISIEGLRTP